MTAPGQVRHAFPAFKVFIYGVDVTEDVFDVEVNWNVGRQPNQCTISLNNELDKYIFTSDDLSTLFGTNVVEGWTAYRNSLIQAASTEEQVQDIRNFETEIEQVILENAQAIQPEVKRDIILSKFPERVPNIQSVDVSGKISSLNPLRGDAFRYPFQAEDPIFHPNDPIRIFFRDPFDPQRWYHMFCGFVSDFDDNVDENNQKVLTITGEGPMKVFRYARIATNPGVTDIDDIADFEIDAVTRTFFSGGFANLTLPELVFLLVFGHDPTGEEQNKVTITRTTTDGKATVPGRINGVGNFNFRRSASIEFGPTSVSLDQEDPLTQSNVPTARISNLGVYQSLIDHEVKESDLQEMASEDSTGQFLSGSSRLRRRADGSVDPLSIIELIGENPQIYPVDGGRILLLVPASFHPETNREVLLKDFIDSPALKSEFRSRMGMLYDVVERIEFSLYESPKGDIIIEFPLYDFDPDDWGLTRRFPHITLQDIATRELTLGGIVGGLSSTLRTGGITDISNRDRFVERGPFGSRWVIQKRDTVNFSKQVTDEAVRTQLVSSYLPVQNYTVGGNTRELGNPVVITLRHLVPLYGYRIEEVDPLGFIANEQAAYLQAHVTLNKMNADARNLGINSVANFGLWLNRPIQFIPRNCVATVNQLTHRIVWGMGGSVDTRINVNYLRGWDGLVDTQNTNPDGSPRPIYTPIGGTPSRPLNYKLLFRQGNQNLAGNNTDQPSGGSETT